MTTPDAYDTHESESSPTAATSRFKITKESIESEQRVPGEHTPNLLSSAIIITCAVLAAVAPMATFGMADDRVSQTWLLIVVLVQEFVLLCFGWMAWLSRKR